MSFSAKLSFSDNPKKAVVEFPLSSVTRFMRDTDELASLQKRLSDARALDEIGDGFGESGRIGDPLYPSILGQHPTGAELKQIQASIDRVARRLAAVDALVFEVSLYEKDMGSSSSIMDAFMRLMGEYDAK